LGFGAGKSGSRSGRGELRRVFGMGPNPKYEVLQTSLSLHQSRLIRFPAREGDSLLRKAVREGVCDCCMRQAQLDERS